MTSTTKTPTTILALLPPPPTQRFTDLELADRVSPFLAPLLQTFKELTESDMKEMLQQRMFESGSYKKHPDHATLYDALEKSMSRDNMEALHEELSKSHHPPPPKDSDQNKIRRHDSDASSSNLPPPKDYEQSTKKKNDSGASTYRQHSAKTSLAWLITDTRDAPSGSSMHMSEPQSEQSSDDTPIPNEEQVSDSDDNDNTYVPKVSPIAEWFRPIPEEDRPETLEPKWTIPQMSFLNPRTTWQMYSPQHIKILRRISYLGRLVIWDPSSNGSANRQGRRSSTKPIWKVKLSTLLKPFTITASLFRGPPRQVTIQPQFFFNKDLEYVLLCDKERNCALSISKLKAARYQDFGLEELVLSLWIKSEREYDIIADYGITHWWFKQKEFYINKHRGPSDRHAVRSHIRILSVISLKTYERYGYNYLREIVLRRADYKEYKISEADFKNLHLNDFEDLKRVEDLQRGTESYQTKLNLEQPNWDASDFLFKEDYMIVTKPRAIIYRDRNDQKKMMRLNEVHKFSDGTLMRIRDKLCYMVKDFTLFEYNKGMENRVWTEDDKRKSKDFIEEIERRLKIRRIFRNLESFVGGRLRDIDYRLITRTE
ncbi:hypothetical protein Tco_1161433 [Tanacetum coccineum]